MNFNHPILRHFVAVIVLSIVAAIYFYPEIQGKKILSHDQVSATAATHESEIYKEKDGERLLWTSRLFSGMPMFLVGYRVKANILNQFYLIFKVFPKSMALWFSLLLGFYIALSLLGYRTELSLIGAIAFGLSTWLLLSIEAGHSSKVLVVSFIPPLLAAIVTTYRGKWLLGGVLTSLFMALTIMLGHPQIVYFAIFFIAAIIFVYGFESLKNKTLPVFIKRSAILLAFAILGVLPNTARLWSTLDYSHHTIRGGKSELTTATNTNQTTGLDFDYAMGWSYGKMETFNLLIPGFFGGGAVLDEKSATYQDLKSKGVPKNQIDNYVKGIPLYYGSQRFTTGPSYLGAAIIFLFFLMFFIYKGRLKWALLITVGISFAFAWGSNFASFNEFMFNNLPLLNKFRTPSMWLSLTMIAAVWGAIIALKTIFEKEYDSSTIKKSLFTAGGITVGIVLFVYLFKSSLTDFSGSYDPQLAQNGLDLDLLIQDRISMLNSDIYRTLFVIALTFGTIWAIVMGKLKNMQLAYFILAIIIVGDLWSVDKRFLNEDDFKKAKSVEKSIVATAADQQISADKELNYRVFNTTVSSFNDNTTSYAHQSVGGYSAAKLIRYQDLIEHHLSKGNMNVFNMLNAKYFITGNPGQEVAQQNPDALGSVWFIDEVSWAKDANDEVAQLTDFTPKKTVIIDNRFKNYLEGYNVETDANQTIQLSSFHPENMVYTSNSAANNFAVFSEVWYKGNEDWKAYIDGKETEFIRVNYLLRGLKIPKGKHEIVFKFYPTAHHTGSVVSLASSILIVLMIIGLAAVHYLKFSLPGLKNDNENEITD